MPGFWENDPVAAAPAAPSAGPQPVFTAPDPARALEEEAKRTSIAAQRSGMTSAASDDERQGRIDRLDNAQKLRKEFYGLPAIASYGTILQSAAAALRAEPTTTGDQQLITAYAKALDPTSVVREGEFNTVENGDSTVGRMWAKLQKEGGIDGAGLLRPEIRDRVRKGLLNLTTTANEAYAQQRSFYSELAKRNGIDAFEIVGPDIGEPFRPVIDQFQQQFAQTGGKANEPTNADIYANGIRWGDQPESGSFDREAYIRENWPELAGKEDLLVGFWNGNRNNPGLTPESVTQWYAANGIPAPAEADMTRMIADAQAGRQFAGIDTSVAEKAYHATLDRILAGMGEDPEAATAAVGGGAATGIMSLFPLGMDELRGVGAAGHELVTGGDMSDAAGAYEVNRDLIRREIERAREAHPYLTTGAELTGALATAPIGFRNVEGIAGAAKAGAALGASAGFNSGEGASDSLLQAGVGGAAGAGLGAAGAKAGEWLATRAANRAAARAATPSTKQTPAQRYAAGQDFGLDLSIGDVGGRGAKMFERSLDAQPAAATRMNEARTNLSEQLDTAVDKVAEGFGPETSFRGMGEAAQAGARKWMDRFSEAAAKLYEAIPIKPETDAAVGATKEALADLTKLFPSNPRLGEVTRNKKLVDYSIALDSGGLSWADLKAFRSEIGEQLGEALLSDGTRKGQLKKLYAAMTKDMEVTAIAQGPAALRAFKRANDTFAAGQARIEGAIKSLIGNNTEAAPEAAAALLQRIAKEGKGSSDLRALADVRKTLRGEEWSQVSNAFIRLLGQPANAAGREFKPDVFVRTYRDMAPEARNLLFGGEKKELRQNLDKFAEVMGGIAENDSTRNVSGSAFGMGNMLTTGAGAVVGNSIPIPLVGPLLGIMMGQTAVGASARLWTNPRFIRWATGYSKMLRGAARNGGQVNPAAHQSQMSALSRVAGADSVIAADALGLQKQLISAFDGADRLAADTGEEPKAKTATTGSEMR